MNKYFIEIYLISEIDKVFFIYNYKVSISLNPNDEDTYVKNKENSKGHNLLNVNILYDVLNKIYLDVIIQGYRKMNEFRALVEMVMRLSIKGKVLLLADRGYESYNKIVYLEKKKWKYLIRVKSPGSKTGILAKTKLPVD